MILFSRTIAIRSPKPGLTILRVRWTTFSRGWYPPYHIVLDVQYCPNIEMLILDAKWFSAGAEARDGREPRGPYGRYLSAVYQLFT